MGNDAGYKRGKIQKVDTSKMTMDDAFAYIEFLMEEQRIIEESRSAKKLLDEKKGECENKEDSKEEILEDNK